MMQARSWLLYSWTLASHMMWCVGIPRGALLRAQPQAHVPSCMSAFSHGLCDQLAAL